MSTTTHDGAQHGALDLDGATFGWLLDAEPDTLRALHDGRRAALDDARHAQPRMVTLEYGTVADVLGAGHTTARDDGWTARDDNDATAAIAETWTHVYADEWHADGTLTVWCVARLRTGCAEWIGRQHVGMATGDATEYRRLRTAARTDAETDATAWRSACRASVAVLGRGDDARGDGWLDAESYGLLRAAVMRWTYGNAGHAGRRSGRQYVRAGIASNGMPVDVHAVDDATQNGALIIQRWMTCGMPESLATLTADLDTDAACRVVIGTAARDGLRMTTRHKTPTTLASDTARWRASRDSHGWTSTRAALAGDTAQPFAQPTRETRTDARPGYVHRSADGLRTDALLDMVLRRSADGTLAAPMLARLLLADGNLDDVARGLGRTTAQGRCTNAARVAILRTARAEWSALTDYDGTTYDDTREWLDGLTFAR